MADREVKFKLGWFNIFNLGGALYGWCSTHTWEGAAWGFGAGTVLPPLFIIGMFLIAFGSIKLAEALPPLPRFRVAEPVRVETDEQRWEREYAEHCKSANLPNELQENYREIAAAPIHGDYEFIRHTTSGGGPG